MRVRHVALAVALAFPVARVHAAPCAALGFARIARVDWKPPLDRQVSVSVPETSLRVVLDRIAAQGRFRLSYVSEFLPLDRRVCAANTSGTVGDLLVTALAGVDVNAVAVSADHVVLAPSIRTTAPAMVASALTASKLERVVVTGSITGGSEHRLPIGVEVVSGSALLARNVNTMADAVNGVVPGMWMWAQSPASPVASFAGVRGASSFGFTQPKIYIDGVQLANPVVLARLTAAAIDRIEVIRGPQGAALYGADAISGVINIVSRQLATRPLSSVVLRSTVGHSQTDFAPGGVAAQDYSATFGAGHATRSGSMALLFRRFGEFGPDVGSNLLAVHASSRFVGATSTATLTARAERLDAGTGMSPVLDSVYSAAGTSGLQSSGEGRQRALQYTVGLNASRQQSERVSHNLTLGADGYSLANPALQLEPLPSAADSALRSAVGAADRITLRAASVVRGGTIDGLVAALTVGMEHSSLWERTRVLRGDQGFGFRPRLIETSATRQNTGLITQGELGYHDALFLSGGLRLERTSGYSLAVEHVLLPMVGAAWVLRGTTSALKLRGAFGEAIRPPRTTNQVAAIAALDRASSRDLRSEVQRGFEFGADLTLPQALSLRVTRFDQRASGLLQSVGVPWSGANSGSVPRRMTYELQNVGEIANAGWELHLTKAQGPLTATGSLSLIDSRVAKVDVRYTGDLRAGDRPLEVPRRVMAMTLDWRSREWTASLTAARASDWMNYDRVALASDWASARDATDQSLYGSGLRAYWREYRGVTRIRAAVSRPITDWLSLLATGENLLGYQRGEPDNLTVVPGRTISLGFSTTFAGRSAPIVH